jgi:hypothetical protein
MAFNNGVHCKTWSPLDSSELKFALGQVAPGDVINLLPQEYKGDFMLPAVSSSKSSQNGRYTYVSVHFWVTFWYRNGIGCLDSAYFACTVYVLKMPVLFQNSETHAYTVKFTYVVILVVSLLHKVLTGTDYVVELPIR